MKLSKFFAGIFGLLGLALGGFTVWLALSSKDASPVLVTAPEAAQSRAEAVMEAVCRGDHALASGMILGNPQFGMESTLEDPVEAMVWELFRESFSYELTGECYATESGVAQRIRVSYLDLDSVTENLRSRSQALMEQRIEAAEDMDKIYDDNNEFLESFVMEALRDAAKEALEEDAGSVTVEVTANLIYRDGQWWILPDGALLSALSGGIVQ